MNNNKKLNICFPLKNDNYYENFIGRVNYSLEYNCSLIKKLSLEDFINISVVDWNSTNKISKEISISKKYYDLVNFYEVDDSISKSESDKRLAELDSILNEDSIIQDLSKEKLLALSREKDKLLLNEFVYIAKANNLILRNSDSDFVFYTSHDMLLSEISLLNLFNLLNFKILNQYELDNCLINIHRFFLPENLFKSTPSIDYLSSWIKRSSFLKTDLDITTGEGQAGNLASKNFWKKIGGINEKYVGYGRSDTDLHSRANMVSDTYFDSFNLGISLYKMPRGKEIGRLEVFKNIAIDWTSFDPFVNNDDWGMRNHKISKKTLNLSSDNFKISNKKKLIRDVKKKKLIITLFSIFSVPVSLRLFFINIKEITLYHLVNQLIESKNVRNFINVGYNNPYGLLFIAKSNQSIGIKILDNLKKIALSKFNNIKSNLVDISSTGMLYYRTHLISLARNKDFCKNIQHLGYFRVVNKISEHQIINIFSDMSLEKDSNVLLFLTEEVKEINFNVIKKLLENNSMKIYAIIFYGQNLNSENISYFQRIDLKIFNIRIYIKEDNIKSFNYLKQYTSVSFYLIKKFILTNLILLVCNIFRINKSIIRKMTMSFKKLILKLIKYEIKDIRYK